MSRRHDLESLGESHTLVDATDAHLELISDEDVRDCVDSAMVYQGDLELDGRLSLHSGAVLIVTGTLTVTGAVLTDETATLIVGKDLRARHLYLEGNLVVNGDATLRGAVYGFYEAGISRVKGTTRAQLGLIGNHDWESGSEEYEIGATFSNYQHGHCEFSSGDADALRAALGADGYAALAKMLGLGTDEPADGNAAWGLKAFANVPRGEATDP